MKSSCYKEKWNFFIVSIYSKVDISWIWWRKTRHYNICNSSKILKAFRIRIGGIYSSNFASNNEKLLNWQLNNMNMKLLMTCCVLKKPGLHKHFMFPAPEHAWVLHGLIRGASRTVATFYGHMAIRFFYYIKPVVLIKSVVMSAWRVSMIFITVCGKCDALEFVFQSFCSCSRNSIFCS